MTQIMSHGKWVTYKPDKLPEHTPAGALFVRRESDGVDWYDYVRDPRSFTTDGVKFTVLRQGDIWTVGAAVRDATRLHPTDALVLEIIDYHGGDDLQETLGGRMFDVDTNKLLDRPPPFSPPNPILEIWGRLAAIEAKLGM